MQDKHYLSMDQLQVGHYVYLDLKWFEHPFAFSHFKIKAQDQIKTIRTLGLKNVRYSPELSEAVGSIQKSSREIYNYSTKKKIASLKGSPRGIYPERSRRTYSKNIFLGIVQRSPTNIPLSFR